MNYQDVNMQAIERWIAQGWEWGTPISHDTYIDAVNGKWDVLLTPTKPVPHHWFCDIGGKKILGLASGGGQQMPIFAALKAECTVLDYSVKQLESEKLLSEREGYAIQIVRGDMTKRLPFDDASFDIIFHPVSNVYVQDVLPVWKECYRVLKKGGILLSGLDNGLNFAYDGDEKELVCVLPYNPLLNPAQMQMAQADDDGIQFSHTIEEQIGGQIAAGFRLMDIYGDTNGTGILREHNIPTFWATKSMKE